MGDGFCVAGEEENENGTRLLTAAVAGPEIETEK